MIWKASGKLMGRPAVNRPECDGIFIKRAPLGRMLSDEASRKGVRDAIR
jgi:hypothetical protein